MGDNKRWRYDVAVPILPIAMYALLLYFPPLLLAPYVDLLDVLSRLHVVKFASAHVMLFSVPNSHNNISTTIMHQF
jgi:hypothetical protein